MFLISDRLPWQGFHAHQTCYLRLIQPSCSGGTGETPQAEPRVLWDWGHPAVGMSTWSCGSLSPVDTNDRSDGVVTFLCLFIFFLSLQLQCVRADLPVSFSVLGQCVTFFMMALYRPHYLPFYYLKIYYLFMHQFNLLFCNELLCGRM